MYLFTDPEKVSDLACEGDLTQYFTISPDSETSIGQLQDTLCDADLEALSDELTRALDMRSLIEEVGSPCLAYFITSSFYKSQDHLYTVAWALFGRAISMTKMTP